MARLAQTTRRSLSWRTAAVALPLAGMLALSACGGSSNASSEGAPTGDKAPLFKDLPKDIQDAGTIQVGSSVDYPPFEYYAPDGKTLKGFETELAALLEKKLGVSFTWNNASFDTLFSALKAGRYDLVYGATNDTAEREQSFDFVYYLQSSQGFVVAKGNPHGIKTVDDLCGKNVAAVRGGVQAQWLDAQAKKCAAEGKGKLTPMTFDGNAGEQLAVKQDKAAAMLENFPTAAAFAKESNGKLELVPDLQVEKQFFGMVLPKDSTELRDTMVKAWNEIIADGSYQKVLDKWDLGQIGIKKSGVNAVASKATAE
ncbi:MAG TPA: ABC transporter substrate-binding protein [Segeticoccus sp.]|uniref:ABC transporter substrate-binding protein n=1 Tax=Segeticoccus sp. TaxID=2706531 RepID=UPI002D804969|nr:ABC transporter substrate-binding protein [Segeticoccus sp.]HET8599528.1 ABC transporter substrate-binding protein [Segeticoccus sp.]